MALLKKLTIGKSTRLLKKIIFSLLLLPMVCQALGRVTQPVSAKHAMVVSEQHLASDAGLAILQAGGNAIDAAVAVGYALAVVQPSSGNLGGGGFMTIHLAHGENIFLNFRERAPFAATQNMFLAANGNILPQKSTLGYLAVAVPGTVLGFDIALKKYGTLTRQQVMQPAIVLAQRGFILTPADLASLQPETAYFKTMPNIAAIFLKNNHALQVGDRLIQKDLAHTLQLISAEGPAIFYQGKIAETIVHASKAHGGILSLKDFQDYSVETTEPVVCTYRDYTVISAPPPSSGGTTLCEMLNILEHYPLRTYGFHSTASAHYTLEAMRYAFYDRNQLGDPDFVKNPTAQFISKEYAASLLQNILDTRATASAELGPKAMSEGTQTTHYSILDKWGNAVSVTYTLNGFFGAKVMAGETGFFLNDEMDDFTLKLGEKNQFNLVQGLSNAIQPGKRPLSSMTPTIILRGNQVVMIAGSPGGPRIITATLQAILNVIDYQMNIQEAVNAPRFHHQWLPDLVNLEPLTFSPIITKQLKTMGYHFSTQLPWGAVEAIYVDTKNKKIYGANDKRRPAGKAVGY